MRKPAWLCVGALTVCLAAVANAVDVTIPVHLYLNKTGGSTKVLAKGTFSLPPVNASMPTVAGGIITFSEGATSESITLPSSGWSVIGPSANPRGFKYKDPTGATCKKVLVKSTIIKALCKATLAGAPPYASGTDPVISVVLAAGSTQTYCAECPGGGEPKGNPDSVTKIKDCAAPVACPSSPIPGTCCDFTTGCGSAPSVGFCLEAAGGIPVGGGAVCDATGDCVAAPGVPGGCCEGVFISSPVCAVGGLDQASCEAGGGTYFSNTVCEPTSECVAEE